MSKQKVKDTSKKRNPERKKSSYPWWMVPGILILTFVAFSPSLDNLFVNWDDDRNIYENETVMNIDQWENIRELFTTTIIGNYNPLSNLLLGIQHQLFENTDFYMTSFHLTNILLHLFCVYMVFLLGGALKLNVRARIILALLFALHPMRVESVAWITEVKDVLYASFFFSGLYLYARQRVDGKSDGFNWKVFLLFAIGLFAKIQMVAFPLALVCIDYIQGRKNLIQSGIKHWPYFLGSLIFGLGGIFALSDQGSLETNETFNLFERIFIGAYSWCIYLIKSIVPYRLSPLYPYPPTLSIWHYLSIVPFLGSLYGIFLLWKKKKSILFFGSLFFLVNIIFLLQILGAGQGYLADRFTYVAYFGLFFVYAYYLDRWMDESKFKSYIRYAFGAMMVMYAAKTYAQNDVWENSGTLWTHVLKYYQHSTLPYGNRANFYRDSGMMEEAMQDYTASINLKGDNPRTFNSRAKLYFSQNKNEEALADYKKAVELDPSNMEYLVNRGAAYAKTGQTQLALGDLSQALTVDPNNANAFLNRSLLWQELRRWDMTIKDLTAYLRLKPNSPDIWYELARVQRIQNRNAPALESLSKAIQLNPQKGIYYQERSKVHFTMGNFSEAGKDAERAEQWGATLEPELINALKAQGVR